MTDTTANKIGAFDLGGDGPLPLEQQKAIEEISAVLAADGIPADIVREFCRRLNAAMRQAVPDDAALELGMQQADAQLRQQYGDKTDGMLKLARGEARRLAKRNPIIRVALENTPLGNDPWITVTLANMTRVRKPSQPRARKSIQPIPAPDRLLRLPQVLQIIPVSKSTWWSWCKTGRAPKPIRLTAGCTCWRRSEILAMTRDKDT